MRITKIMNAQASARPKPNLGRSACTGSAAWGVASWEAGGAGGAVSVAMSPSSGQVGLAGPGESILRECDDRQDHEQGHRHGRGVAELEAAERDVVDVVLEHP